MGYADATIDVLPVEVGTGNVLPLLHEIRHALQAWLEHGEAASIDLRRLPLAPGEEQRIIDTLGEGEVRVAIDAMGPSEIIETRFAGVWLVTHRNTDDAIIGRFIEITAMPAIALSQAEDAREGLARLQESLNPSN